ncbi:MAG: hypothetical protein N2645_14560 [Clostridia bacterium]|nr:hypothetical protein [Clostridia bacterium]
MKRAKLHLPPILPLGIPINLLPVLPPMPPVPPMPGQAQPGNEIDNTNTCLIGKEIEFRFCNNGEREIVYINT